MITVLDECFPNWWVVTPIRVVTPMFSLETGND